MRFVNLINRYDRSIWIRVIGTILTTVTSFAIRPFLAVYLYDKTGNIYYIGIILGLAPLMGVFTNLFAGSLADIYGRKPLMVLSLFFQALSMAGYVFAVTPLHFCLVSVINGLASSLFFPAANAQIADIVPDSQRSEVFALMHSALNVGAAFGPMLGLLMVKINQNIAFIASSISLLVYGILVVALIPETYKMDASLKPKFFDSVKPGKINLKDHKLLISLTLLTMPISLLYAQVESNFPLYLKANFDNYLTIFTSLMTMNGVIVVLTAVWLAKKTEKRRMDKVLLLGYILFALVGAGYGIGPALHFIPLLFVTEAIFTVGECITFPNQNKLISLTAPSHMRGRYFSIFSLHWGLSRSIGPLLGAALFANVSGVFLFITLACLILVSGLLVYGITGRKIETLQPVTASISK